MATSLAAAYRERPFLVVSFTHFFVDVLNNGRNLLVALLAGIDGGMPLRHFNDHGTIIIVSIAVWLSQPNAKKRVTIQVLLERLYSCKRKIL